MKLISLLLLCAVLFTPYIWNAYKFANCDFKSDYKCEAIHGVGLIPSPAAFVTVWFDDDSDK